MAVDTLQPTRDDVAPEPVIRRRYVRFRGPDAEIVDEPVVGEIRLSIVVNGEELVQLMCSPRQLNALVIGFLHHEGIIDSADDVEALRVCLEDRVAEVWLAVPTSGQPKRRIITSGCTGGTTFGEYLDELERLRLPDDDVRLAPAAVYRLLRELHEHAVLYRRSGGIHTSILATVAGETLVVAEDIGRHNTLDKLHGECLLRGVQSSGAVIMASGRISSEMLVKAALMGVPVVASRTSPTQLAVSLAERLNVTVVGYVRSASMNVYTHPRRVIGAPLA